MARFACLDLVEDRVRSRLLAVVLIFALFCPLIGLVGVDEETTSFNHTAEGTGPLASLGPAMSAICVSESLCLTTSTNVSSCSSMCLSSLGFQILSPPPVAPPQPMAPPRPSSPPPTAEEVDANTFTGILFVLVIVAMFGNSSFCPAGACLPASILALVLTLVLLAIVTTSWNILSVAWLMSTLLALLAYLLVLVGMVAKRLGKFPEGGLLSAALSSFSDYRDEAYMDYVRQLLSDKSISEAREALAAGEATGNLTWARRSELEREIEKEDAAQFGLVGNAKAILGLSRRSEAIFVPIRLIASTCASMLVLVLIAQYWVSSGAYMRDYIFHLNQLYIGDALTLIDTVSLSVQNSTGVEPGDGGVRVWVVFAQEHIAGMARAWFAAAVCGATLALLFFVLSSILLLGSFRSAVLRARRGEYNFKVNKVPYTAAWKFTGGQVANAVVAFFLISAVLGLVIFVLAWSLTWTIVGMLFSPAFLGPIFSLAGTFIINFLITFAVKKWLSGPRLIKKRFAWMAYDFLQLFVGLLTGVISALVRILMAAGLLFAASLRIDRSLFPAWIDEIIVLDAMAKSFRAVVLLYHHHNNPVAHVFIRLAAEAAAARRATAPPVEKASGTEAGGAKPVRRWGNMWRKVAFMALNPKVAVFRASPEDAPKKASRGLLPFGKKKAAGAQEPVLTKDGSKQATDVETGRM